MFINVFYEWFKILSRIQFKLWKYIINIFYVAAREPDNLPPKMNSWMLILLFSSPIFIELLSTKADASAQILFKE